MTNGAPSGVVGLCHSICEPSLMRGLQLWPSVISAVHLSPFSLLVRTDRRYRFFASGHHLTPNPLLYKYYWWIVTASDHALAWRPAGNLYEMGFCTFDFEVVRDLLDQYGASYVVGNTRRPRADRRNPFTESKSDHWAPSLINDPDPVVNGHR